MRRKFFMFTIAVAAMLTSCNRHESLLTGGYGERVVAGQVVMASEMADSSPAGVEVSVVGTGMSAILAADGRFTFAGVPADAELAFRRADGVDARIRVSSPAPLLVELAGKTATSNGSHRRGVSTKDPGPSQQIEGVIRAVSTTSLTVFDEHQTEVKVALTTTTLIRKGNQTLTAADLKVNDRVHVKALMMDNVLTATQVIVQEQENDGGGDDADHGTTMTANGTVKSVSGTTLVVTTESKGDVTVNTDTSTIIKKQDQRITVADIKAGDEVNCLGTRVDDHTMTAKQIEVRGNSKHD